MHSGVVSLSSSPSDFQPSSMSSAKPTLISAEAGTSISYQGVPFIVEMGLGVPIHHHWHWSFDGSLRLTSTHQEKGRDHLGKFTALESTYADRDGPLVRQQLKTYEDNASLVVEATALRDLQGTALADSFFNTTFNAPVIRLAEGSLWVPEDLLWCPSSSERFKACGYCSRVGALTKTLCR